MRLSLILCLSCAVLCASAQETSTSEPSLSSEASSSGASSDTPSSPSSIITTPEPAPSTSTTPPTPVTSSTSAPSTTEVPIPTPPKASSPTAIDYQLVSDDNVTCIIAKFAAQFDIPYNQTNNNSVIGYLNIVNGTVDKSASSCGNESSVLAVVFGDKKDTLLLNFVQDDSSRYVKKLVLTYTPTEDLFPGHPNLNKQQTETFENQTIFKVDLAKSYLCNAERDVTSESGATAKLSEAHVDAFRTSSSGTEYRQSQDCATDDVSDLVPIAVGIALLALVVIVLIAYFIGRRRSRRLAYQSV